MSSAAEIIRKNYLACKVLFTPWWTQRKAVARTTKAKMASVVQAQERSIGSSKVIYNTELPAIAQINSLRQEVKDYWESRTLPYKDDGVRLLRKADLDNFDAYMKNAKERIQTAAADVQHNRDSIIADAQDRLGEAFSLSDYPLDLSELYGMEVTYPALSPNGSLPPEILEQQKQILLAKINQSVIDAQQWFTNEFAQMVSALTERLTPDPDGKKKIFRDSAVHNIKDMIKRFEQVKDVVATEELERLIEDTSALIKPYDAQDLRDSNAARNEVATGLGKIEQELAKFITKAPRRAIIKPKKPSDTNGAIHAPSPEPALAAAV